MLRAPRCEPRSCEARSARRRGDRPGGRLRRRAGSGRAAFGRRRSTVDHQPAARAVPARRTRRHDALGRLPRTGRSGHTGLNRIFRPIRDAVVITRLTPACAGASRTSSCGRRRRRRRLGGDRPMPGVGEDLTGWSRQPASRAARPADGPSTCSCSHSSTTASCQSRLAPLAERWAFGAWRSRSRCAGASTPRARAAGEQTASRTTSSSGPSRLRMPGTGK